MQRAHSFGSHKVGRVVQLLAAATRKTLAGMPISVHQLFEQVTRPDALPSRLVWFGATDDEREQIFNAFVDHIDHYDDRETLCNVLMLVVHRSVEQEEVRFKALETLACIVMAQKYHTD